MTTATRLSILFISSALVGCSHQLHKPVSEPDDSRKVWVEMQDDEVAANDQIEILEQQCREVPLFRGGHRHECSYRVIGHAKVLSKANAGRVEVQLPEKFQLKPEMKFEKIKSL